MENSKVSAIKKLTDSVARMDSPTPSPDSSAVEIESNEYVEGNEVSKAMYNQTKDEDNGLGMPKSASYKPNPYLEKIASAGWIKRLGKSFVEAEPLQQLGVGSSVVGLSMGIGKSINDHRNRSNAEKSTDIQEKSLKALVGINKTLSTAKVVPVKKAK